MKKILEKIGLSDIFEYICPGLVFLPSFALWIKVKTWSFPWKQLQSHQVLSVIVVLILSYTLGLILTSFNASFMKRSRGKIWYTDLSKIEQKGFFKRLWRNIVTFFYPAPFPKYTRLEMNWQFEISGDLERLSRLTGLSGFIGPWDLPATYRVFKAEHMSDALLKSKFVLEEANNLHRKFLFCTGVAMGIFLLAMQSLARLALFGIGHLSGKIDGLYDKLPSINSFLLLAIALLGLLASFELRQTAVRIWALERYLTASLVRSDEEESIPDQSLS